MSAAQLRAVAEAWQPYRLDSACFVDLDTRVHVWRVRLDGLADDVGDTLSEDEQARAGRLPRPEDRRRFVACRGALRKILADCLDSEAAPEAHRLRFRYGPAGKPFLIEDQQLRFNVSHSEDLAVIAVTRSGDVGIDIERQRPMRDVDGIARCAFSDAEQAAILGCPPAGREAVFYRIWTRKEALLKAMGLGLPTLHDADALALAQGGGAWLVTTLPHFDDHVAALARPRGAHGLKLWSWPNAIGMRCAERRARPRPMPLAPLPSPFRLEVRR